MSERAAPSIGASILAGGRAGLRVETLLADLLPDEGPAPLDELVLVLEPPDSRDFAEWKARARRLGVRFEILELAWPHDFSRARTFAFERQTSEWRGYLDSDDRFPDAAKLRPLLEELVADASDVSALALPHVHVRAGYTVQPIRFVRWADGFRWHGAVHENLVSTGDDEPAVAFLPELPVMHQATAEDAEHSLVRNEAIIDAALERARADGDGREEQRLLCHRAMNLAARGNAGEALLTLEKVYRNSVGAAVTAPVAYLGALRAAELCGSDGVGAVLDWAGRAIAAMPTQQGGWAKLLLAYVSERRWADALAAWNGWQACGAAPQLEWRESETLGLVPAAGALALVACGEQERAEDVLSRIPPALSEQEPARSLIAAARQAMLAP